ncbi:MAG: hypothetical protein QNJ05_08730 [Woeseiaceae bacterium]|nr:hypothetical protein [Woeseiaceae bacterium]
MSLMRPGTKIPFWSPKFTNRADVSPPFLLRLVAGIGFFSVAGVLVYGVAHALGHTGSTVTSLPDGLYIAILHCLLPIGISYSIFANSPLSRPLLAVYVLILGSATALGYGLLGSLTDVAAIRASVVLLAAGTTLFWLFRNSRMRVYFALIAGRPVPPELEEHAERLEATNGFGTKARQTIEWLVESVELLILLGFIVTVFYSFYSTGA